MATCLARSDRRSSGRPPRLLRSRRKVTLSRRRSRRDGGGARYAETEGHATTTTRAREVPCRARDSAARIWLVVDPVPNLQSAARALLCATRFAGRASRPRLVSQKGRARMVKSSIDRTIKKVFARYRDMADWAS